MDSLFNSKPIPFALPDSEIFYFPETYNSVEAAAFFLELKNTIPWQQDTIKIFGKTHQQPRLTALFGIEGKPYSYSNITMQPHHFTPFLELIKKKVEQITGATFNTVLLNYYRDGKDSNGWHADNEKELGINPVIASLSFGAARIFHLKHKSIASHKKQILLENGSLLLMKGTTQHFWKHQIPKTNKVIGPRINLTFRTI